MVAFENPLFFRRQDMEWAFGILLVMVLGVLIYMVRIHEKQRRRVAAHLIALESRHDEVCNERANKMDTLKQQLQTYREAEARRERRELAEKPLAAYEVKCDGEHPSVRGHYVEYEGPTCRIMRYDTDGEARSVALFHSPAYVLMADEKIDEAIG